MTKAHSKLCKKKLQLNNQNKQRPLGITDKE
jgi:hypothetical protein